MAVEGQHPKADGDILFASEFNLTEASRWNELVYTTQAHVSLLAHSATAWTVINGGSSKITSDSGVTWTAATTDFGQMTGVSRISKADGTLAISCDHDGIGVANSSDSGDTWAQASTDPAQITAAYDLAFPTATVAVMCGAVAAGESVYYSTDAGDIWTVTATNITGANVFCLDMVDGSDGILVDDSNNIYTTSDGGVNWTDSTNNSAVTPTRESSLIALTSTTGVILHQNTSTIETFTTGAGGTIRFSIPDAGEAQGYTSNIVKTTNGNLYFMYWTFSDAGDRGINAVLYKSEDSGVTWSQKSLGANLYEVDTDLTTGDTKSQIVEFDTNKLLISIGRTTLAKINESGA